MKAFLARASKQGLRLVLLVAIIAASGIGLGLAAGFPVSQVEFTESDAVSLNQSRLVGEIDPAQSVVAESDLPLGWEAGDENLGAFTLLGAGFCGEEVPLPTEVSPLATAVYANPSDDSFLISAAVQVNRWQSARDYVSDVDDAVSSCDRFFRPSFDGERVEVEIREGMGDPPITDHVARTFIAENGDSVQTWSIMAVGDVIVSLLYGGPTRPQEGLLTDLEDRILLRVDPLDFAPGGVPSTSTTSTIAVVPSQDTVPGGVEEPTDPVDGIGGEPDTPALPPEPPG